MVIVANWKAYVDTTEKAKKLLATSKRLSAKTGITIVLAPPLPYLGLMVGVDRRSLQFSAQDISRVARGAHTGEVTAGMIKDLGASYVIVGHSEKRAGGDTDAIVLEKTKQALLHGLTPIVCVGETKRDPDARYLQHLRQQMAAICEPLSPKERSRIMLAYEPVWAINKTAEDAITPHDLAEMILYIRKVLATYLPGKGSHRIKILYGGSAEPENARALAAESRIDGFLVGHASVDAEIFSALVKSLV